MKQSKDPFEVAFEEQEAESPPDSPIAPGEGMETQTQPHSHVQSESTAAAELALNSNEDEDDDDAIGNTNFHPTSMKPPKSRAAAVPNRGKSKEEEEEEEEEEEDENMEDELAKIPSSGDPDKMAKMHCFANEAISSRIYAGWSILSQLTEEQMSRYESFRRSGFQKPNMKRLLASITGSAKISLPMTIVVSGIAKMFVGELVETARIEMARRKESGPIRPSHIREAYRKLKLEGKVPKRSVPRLFR